MRTLFLYVFSAWLFIAGTTTFETQAQTVYITKTGSKYHTSGCRYLRSSCIAISMSDAKNSGYGACSVCRPPISVSEKAEQKTPSKKEDQDVFICVSRSAEVYHSHQCWGLEQCTHEIKKLKKSEAIALGRRACRICY